MSTPSRFSSRERIRAAKILIPTVIGLSVLAVWQSRASSLSAATPAGLPWQATAQERAIASYWSSRTVGQLPVMPAGGATPDLRVSPELSGPFGWAFIGPEPMNLGGVVGTGRVTAIAADPSLSGRIFVGTAGGGVWSSTDGGLTFKPIFDLQPNLAVGAIALDAVNTVPPTVYVATREGNGMLSSTFGALSNDTEFLGAMHFGSGIYKSTNLGASWTALAAGTFDRVAFSRLAIDTSHKPTDAVCGGGRRCERGASGSAVAGEQRAGFRFLAVH